MDLCRICGLQFGSRSFGGPGICPACDCGLPPQNRIPNTNEYFGPLGTGGCACEVGGTCLKCESRDAELATLKAENEELQLKLAALKYELGKPSWYSNS